MKPVVSHTSILFWVVHSTIVDSCLYQQITCPYFLYCFIYIHLHTINCKNDNNIKARKQRCWRNFSNRSLLGTIKQTHNDGFLNRVKKARINVLHSKGKPNGTWTNAHLNSKSGKSGKCHKSTTVKKQQKDSHNSATMHKWTADIVSGSNGSYLKDRKQQEWYQKL